MVAPSKACRQLRDTFRSRSQALRLSSQAASVAVAMLRHTSGGSSGNLRALCGSCCGKRRLPAWHVLAATTASRAASCAADDAYALAAPSISNDA